jgi:hypothetical protein
MLLLASSILFLTLFLEGVLRLLPIDRTVISQLMTHNKYVDANTSNAISVIDYKPNTSFRHQSTEFDYEIKINSKGLRSREISYEKNKGEFRILVIGPSWCFGWGVPIENSIPFILEQKLRNHYRTDQITVINAGVPGQWVFGNLLFYMKEGYKYHPDAVIQIQAHDFSYQGIEDLKKISNADLILKEDDVFKLLYKKVSEIPLVRNSVLFYFTTERLRRSYIARGIIRRYAIRYGFISFGSLEKQSEEKINNFLKLNEIENPLFASLIRKKFDLLDSLSNFSSKEIIDKIYMRGAPGSYKMNKVDIKAQDPAIQAFFNGVGGILHDFMEILRQQEIMYLFYNIDGHALLSGLDAEKDKLISDYAAASLHSNSIPFISYDNYLFNDLGYSYGDHNMKEIFYPLDRHPTKKGYALLSEILYNKVITLGWIGDSKETVEDLLQ